MDKQKNEKAVRMGIKGRYVTVQDRDGLLWQLFVPQGMSVYQAMREARG